jgi:hypothetical protein
MKNLFKAIVIVSMFFMVSYTAPAKVQAQGVGVSFQVFYDQLSPYGNWVNYPQYGYVWMPYTAPGFSPYSTNGYWAWTDYGWTWVSYYDWGWGPFHYGRWDYDPFYGWFWVPGYEWGPAWVCWRHAPGYYGWAPIAPGVSMTVVMGGRWHPHHDRWQFMHDRHMGDHYIDRYYEPRTDNDRIIRRSSYVKHTYIDRDRHATYISGPKRTDVEKTTGKPVERVEVVDRSTPGHSVENNKLNIYRPRVEAKEDNNNKPVPRKVEDLKNVPDVKTRQENYKKNPPQRQPEQQQQPQRQPEQPQKQEPQRQPEQQPQRQPERNPQQQPQKQEPQRQPEQQPQRQPERQPEQQPQKQEPQRQPERQRQQEPQRQPEQQPQKQEPQRQPEQQPQRQPERQPQQQPQRLPERQPERQPQRQEPQRQPEQQPQRQPERQPQQQPQRQMPKQDQPRQMPRQQQQRQLPRQQRETKSMPQQNQEKVNPRPENSEKERSK